jgi:hypothetical protein
MIMPLKSIIVYDGRSVCTTIIASIVSAKVAIKKEQEAVLIGLRLR